MSPFEYYQQQFKQGLIKEDINQLHALRHFGHLQKELIKENNKRKGMLSFVCKPAAIRGLYVWGGVGIGKTFLMDCFYHTLPFNQKMRMHFHQFMHMIQKELKNHQGEKNPLKKVAEKIARQAMVICFDEFFVSDIADAMILANLLKALFDNGVCLVTTSNIIPDELYKRGLQRQSFLPAIALLKKHTTIIHLPTTYDYRLENIHQKDVFYSSCDSAAQTAMENIFARLTPNTPADSDPIEIHGRSINIVKKAADIVWFDFNVICNIPRSQHDYLAIAKIFKTIFISNIPIIPPEANNQINLFIKMIDVFYDARIRVVISAADKVDNLYKNGRFVADFTRTRSRLIEMQSEKYLHTNFR